MRAASRRTKQLGSPRTGAAAVELCPLALEPGADGGLLAALGGGSERAEVEAIGEPADHGPRR